MCESKNKAIFSSTNIIDNPLQCLPVAFCNSNVPYQFLYFVVAAFIAASVRAWDVAIIRVTNCLWAWRQAGKDNKTKHIL